MENSRRRFQKYSPQFKQKAVDRFQAGEGASAVARELGIRRKFLYQWRDEGWGSKGDVGKGGKAAAGRLAASDPQEREKEALQKKVKELEQLVGRQSAEISFFVAALRSVEEFSRKKKNKSGGNSTKLSKTSRKAKPRTGK